MVKAGVVLAERAARSRSAVLAAALASHAATGRFAIRPLMCHADATPVHELTVPLPTTTHTLMLGSSLATLVSAGDTLLLHGDYGAGKTALARGFLQRWFAAEGGVAGGVTSPSYLIDNCYPDETGGALLPGVAVHHMDLWRLPEGKIAQLVDLPNVFTECVSLIGVCPQCLFSFRCSCAH